MRGSTASSVDHYASRFPRARTILLLVLLFVLLWTLFEIGRAALGAQQTQHAAQDLRSAAQQQDWAALPEASRRLESGADRFARATSSPPLRLIGMLPAIGDDVQAVRVAALALDQAASGVTPLLSLGQQLDPNAMAAGGRVDIARVQALTAPVATAAAAMTEANTTLSTVDTSQLASPLQRAFEKARAQVSDVVPQAQLAATATATLPNVLGGDAPRSYLLALQNPAEARPTGGIIGSYALIEVRDGTITLKETGVNNDLAQLKPADLQVLDPTTRALYGYDQALSQNFNLSPDFRQAGALFARQWVKNGRPPVDGVISVDPSVMQAILTVTGPVAVKGGPPLTGTTAASVLMDRAYRELGGDTAARNAYLEASTRTVFTQLLKPTTDLRAVVETLAKQPVRGHIMAWSQHADENTMFEEAGVSGRLPAPTSGTVGVFVTNADASKLDYFLHQSVKITEPCLGNGPSLQLSLRNAAPRTVAEYTSNKLPGAAPTDHTVNIAWYLPPDRGMLRVTRGGQILSYAAGREQGWTVVRIAVTIPRGRTVTLSTDLTGGYLPVQTLLDQPSATEPAVTRAACKG